MNPYDWRIVTYGLIGIVLTLGTAFSLRAGLECILL